MYDSRIKKILNSKKIPIWLMRQAGRYLPEYKKIRSTKKSFLDVCYDSKLVAKITLQPLERFDLDLAIIFSDILTIPHAMGVKVDFIEKKGPVLEKISSADEINLNIDNFLKVMEPVYEGIHLTKSKLSKDKPLIGFIGGVWTVATYMIEGQGSKTFEQIKNLAYNKPETFKEIINILTEYSIIHLKNQIKSGVDLIQIFDTWAGVLDETNFYNWIILPTKKIIAEIRKDFPDIPIIGFPKSVSSHYSDYIKQTDVDILSLSSEIEKTYVIKNLPKKFPVQGNLDPIYLLTQNKKALEEKIIETLSSLKDNLAIFNLGHGVLPSTPIENVEFLIKTIRKYEKENSGNII